LFDYLLQLTFLKSISNLEGLYNQNVLFIDRTVPIKESSILVATSSPRRADAIAATARCLDLVKSAVPIWKKEVYADGTTKWMSNSECSWNNSK